jgi:Tfp pilus assembly protein PilO
MAAVLVVAIVAAGWFLLVSPKRGEAVELRDQAKIQEEANQRLLTDLALLKDQQEQLPTQRAELAVMRKQIPDNPSLPTLIRSLTESGRKVGVSIDSMAPALPVAVVQPVTTVVAPTTTDPATSSDTSSSDSSTSTDATATTPVVPAAPPAPSLYQVPLTLDVTGSYFELEQFINKLEGLKRSFLVTGFTVGPAGTGAEATGDSTEGAPAPGDLTIKIQGRVFLAPPIEPVTTQPTPAVSTATGQ